MVPSRFRSSSRTRDSCSGTSVVRAPDAGQRGLAPFVAPASVPTEDCLASSRSRSCGQAPSVQGAATLVRQATERVRAVRTCAADGRYLPYPAAADLYRLRSFRA